MCLVCTNHANYSPCFTNITPGINSQISVGLCPRYSHAGTFCSLPELTFVQRTPSETVIAQCNGICDFHRGENKKNI